MKNQDIEKIIVDTVRHDANMIYCKLIDLDDINRNKYEMMKNLTTTELIDNVDILTLESIAHEQDLDIHLPNKQVRGTHVYIEYKWGTAILLANMTEN